MSKVVIIVSGGNVQEVWSDGDVDVKVIDHDNLGITKHEDKKSFDELMGCIDYPTTITTTNQINDIIDNEMVQYKD
jgi:hypothetical protein